MTNNTMFTFRSKFEKLLNDENRPIIVAAFEKFFKLKPDSARDLLWRMSYDVDVAFAALNELGLTQEIISSEKISYLRNELRHQYEKLEHPNFLDVDVPGECQEAFTALANHTDAIVANIVFEHCKSCLYVDEGNMNRLLYLLGSDKENNFFGGIRSLHFSIEAATYLKPYHMQIHDLMKAMYEDYQAKLRPAEDNRPFAGLANLIEEAGIDLPFDFGEVSKEACNEPVPEALAEMGAEAPVEAPAKEPAQTDCGFKPLTAEAITANKELFDNFVKSDDLNILCQIGKLGFDLNSVVSKKDKITALLKASASVEKAVAKMAKATADLNKAEIKFSKAADALKA